MNKIPHRVTKADAKKLWEHDKPFVIAACKCRPYIQVKKHYELGFNACIVYPQALKDDYTFNEMVEIFKQSNCCYFTGTYPAYYEAIDDVLATYV